MTNPWPNSMYAEGQTSPDALAFYDPPTQADIIRAHQMVAQSRLGLATFAGAQALILLPGIFQGAVGQGFDALVNWFAVFCIAGAICGYVVSFRLSAKSTFSPHIVAAHKFTAIPKRTGRALAILIALVAPAFCVLGFLVLGYCWAFAHYNVPRWAVSSVEAAAALSSAGLLVGLAYQYMKRALDFATKGTAEPV